MFFFRPNFQASVGEVSANRGHPGVSAGQWGRTRAAGRGGGDDNRCREATAGDAAASHQQVSTLVKAPDPSEMPFGLMEVRRLSLFFLPIQVRLGGKPGRRNYLSSGIIHHFDHHELMERLAREFCLRFMIDVENNFFSLCYLIFEIQIIFLIAQKFWI